MVSISISTLYIYSSASAEVSNILPDMGAACNMGMFCISEGMAEDSDSTVETHWSDVLSIFGFVIILMFRQTKSASAN